MTTFTECPTEDDNEEDSLFWFFLYKYGILKNEFSVGISAEVEAVDDYDYGKVWVQLSWGTLDDLDLWLIDPDGNRIWYGAPEQVCAGKTGTLDVDANAGLSMNITTTPIERIAYDDPPRGNFTVIVSFYEATEENKTIPFSLLVQTGTGLVQLTDTITITTGNNNDFKTMLTFEY